jgi:hypothetical protein
MVDVKVPKSWTIRDLDKEIDRLRRESRELADTLERLAFKQGYGKETTTLDVQIEDSRLAIRGLVAYRDLWLRLKRRPTDAEVAAALR